MTTLHRHSDLPRRRTRQGHRRGAICRRVQRRRSRLRLRRRLDHPKGRIARIDASRALAVEGVIDVLTHENRPKMAGTARPTVTMWRRAARRFVRSTTTRSCSTASRSRWCSPRSGRSRASRRRWCRSNTRRKPTPPTCMPALDKASSSRNPTSRAATRRRPMRRPRCATRPSISSRPSITTRWSCLPRR